MKYRQISGVDKIHFNEGSSGDEDDGGAENGIEFRSDDFFIDWIAKNNNRDSDNARKEKRLITCSAGRTNDLYPLTALTSNHCNHLHSLAITKTSKAAVAARP